jgi:hypothetical protein
MYNSGFVVSTKINGRTVEEKDGKVVIPFDSEYSLMLKNRNDRKAVARVYIDGEEATEKGRLILDANASINLERFIDDMDKGRKFKFVPISDRRVNDKGDSEKGFIEVRFQLVKPVVNNVIVHEEHIYHHPRRDWYHDWSPFYPYKWNQPYFVDTTFQSATLGSSMTLNASACNSVNSVSSFACTTSPTSSIQHDAYIKDNHLVEEAGATVKGSNSSQKFSYSYIGELESTEIVIRFQLVGTKDEKIADQYLKTHCTKCGKKYDVNDNYCAKCGTQK